MGLNWAEHTVEIAAPIETCFAAITDYETFPAWQSAVVDTEVLDWDKKGRGKRVRLFVDAKVRKVDYTLDYRYQPPERIEWDFVEGNGINGADGHYHRLEADLVRTLGPRESEQLLQLLKKVRQISPEPELLDAD